jgi:hypothetical protein
VGETISGTCGSVGTMLTIRRSDCRSQKNVAETDENSPRLQPASIHSIIAAMNTRLRSDPRGISRDSSSDPCIERTTTQRGVPPGSNGLNVARLRTMTQTYRAAGLVVYPVVRIAASCMDLWAR